MVNVNEGGMAFSMYVLNHLPYPVCEIHIVIFCVYDSMEHSRVSQRCFPVQCQGGQRIKTGVYFLYLCIITGELFKVRYIALVEASCYLSLCRF